MNEPDALRTQLRELLHRSLTDHIRRGEQAYSLAMEMGEHAWRIHREHFGPLFHVLQVSLADELVLAITKLFESPDHRYPHRRSIKVVLQWLTEHAAVLVLEKRALLEQVLIEAGRAPAVVSEMPDPQLIVEFANTINQTIPKPKAFWIRRDKRIAHTDDVVVAEENLPSWDDAESLLKYAQDIAGIIGEAFGVYWFKANDGSYMLSGSAREPAKLLRRLLEQADLLDVTKGERRRLEYRGVKFEVEKGDVIWIAQTMNSDILLTGVGASEEEAIADLQADIDEQLTR